MRIFQCQESSLVEVFVIDAKSLSTYISWTITVLGIRRDYREVNFDHSFRDKILKAVGVAERYFHSFEVLNRLGAQ